MEERGRAAALCDSRNKNTSRETHCSPDPPEATWNQQVPCADSRAAIRRGRELGESCWVSEGRRGGQAGREVSEFSIAVVLFCRVSELKQPQQDQTGGTVS